MHSLATRFSFNILVVFGKLAISFSRCRHSGGAGGEESTARDRWVKLGPNSDLTRMIFPWVACWLFRPPKNHKLSKNMQKAVSARVRPWQPQGACPVLGPCFSIHCISFFR